MNYTVQQLKDIVAEACSEAETAANLFFQTRLNGRDQYACGFAWVNIHGIKGNTKLGRAMKEAGIRQDYTKAFQIWNPSGHPAQNVDVKEAGAEAAAEVFRRYGFDAYAGSRLD
jgi:hypothetical protein